MFSMDPQNEGQKRTHISQTDSPTDPEFPEVFHLPCPLTFVFNVDPKGAQCTTLAAIHVGSHIGSRTRIFVFLESLPPIDSFGIQRVPRAGLHRLSQGFENLGIW